MICKNSPQSNYSVTDYVYQLNPGIRKWKGIHDIDQHVKGLDLAIPNYVPNNVQNKNNSCYNIVIGFLLKKRNDIMMDSIYGLLIILVIVYFIYAMKK